MLAVEGFAFGTGTGGGARRRFGHRYRQGSRRLAGLASGAFAQAKCEDPKAIRFSIIPTEETLQELTLYKPIVDLLAKNTGKKVEFYMPTSYASVIEAMLGNWVDVAVHGPNSYVIGNEKSKTIEVFATYANQPNNLAIQQTLRNRDAERIVLDDDVAICIDRRHAQQKCARGAYERIAKIDPARRCKKCSGVDAVARRNPIAGSAAAPANEPYLE